MATDDRKPRGISAELQALLVSALDATRYHCVITVVPDVAKQVCSSVKRTGFDGSLHQFDTGAAFISGRGTRAQLETIAALEGVQTVDLVALATGPMDASATKGDSRVVCAPAPPAPPVPAPTGPRQLLSTPPRGSTPAPSAQKAAPEPSPPSLPGTVASLLRLAPWLASAAIVAILVALVHRQSR